MFQVSILLQEKNSYNFLAFEHVLFRKSTACSYPTKLKSMQKVRKIFISGEQKQGRCGGSQRISFRSGVKLEFRFNRKFLVWNIDHNIFLDENNKPEPSHAAETKPESIFDVV